MTNASSLLQLDNELFSEPNLTFERMQEESDLYGRITSRRRWLISTRNASINLIELCVRYVRVN